MSDQRMIIEFFNKEAPSIGITQELLNVLPSKCDEIIQAYHFLCTMIFENMGAETGDDRGTEPLLARPTLIIKTREAVNTILGSIRNANDEFCFTDLLQPDPRRTKLYLAQLIRFYNFKCEIAKQIVEADNQIEEQFRSYHFESQLAKQADEKLEQMKEEMAELESRKQHVEHKELELRQKLDDKKAEKELQKKNNQANQERLKEMEIRFEENKKKLVELENTSKRLEANIVNSPARLTAELEQLTLEKKTVQQKLDNALQENRKLERQVAEYQMIGQSLNALVDEMDKLENEQHRMMELRAIEEKSQQEINELDMRKKGLLLELEHMEKQFQSELSCLKGEIQINQKEIEAIQQQRMQLESDEKEMAGRVVKVRDEIRQHQQLLKRKDRMFIIATDKYDQAVQKMVDDCNKLKKKVDEQQEVLAKVVNKAKSAYGLK